MTYELWIFFWLTCPNHVLLLGGQARKAVTGYPLVVPVAKAVFRYGGSRASCSRCQPSAPHRLSLPGATVTICHGHPYGACR